MHDLWIFIGGGFAGISRHRPELISRLNVICRSPNMLDPAYLKRMRGSVAMLPSPGESVALELLDEVDALRTRVAELETLLGEYRRAVNP